MQKRPANFDEPRTHGNCFTATRSMNTVCPNPNAVNRQHCLFAFGLRKFDLLGATRDNDAGASGPDYDQIGVPKVRACH